MKLPEYVGLLEVIEGMRIPSFAFPAPAGWRTQVTPHRRKWIEETLRLYLPPELAPKEQCLWQQEEIGWKIVWFSAGRGETEVVARLLFVPLLTSKL